jgi:hypothetical protein
MDSRLTIVSIIIFLFFCFVSTKAQDNKNLNHKLSLGIKQGISISDTYGGSDLDVFQIKKSERIGITFGATGIYSFSDIFSLKIGLNYEQKGFKTEMWEDNITFSSDSGGSYTCKNSYFGWDVTNKYDYLTMPVLANIHFGKKFKVFFETGTYYGFILSARYNGYHDCYIDPEDATHFEGQNITPGHNKTEYNTNMREGMTKFNLGLTFGTGIQILIKNKFNLLVYTRYNYGLTRIYKKSFESNFVTNRTIDSGLGLVYNI